MKFGVDDRNRCRLVCVKFHLNRCRFAVAVAKRLWGSLFGTQCIRVLVKIRTHNAKVNTIKRRYYSK